MGSRSLGVGGLSLPPLLLSLTLLQLLLQLLLQDARGAPAGGASLTLRMRSTAAAE